MTKATRRCEHALSSKPSGQESENTLGREVRATSEDTENREQRRPAESGPVWCGLQGRTDRKEGLISRTQE